MQTQVNLDKSLFSLKSNFGQSTYKTVPAHNLKISQLVIMGEERLRVRDIETARQVFQLALKLSPGHERATIGLCSVTEDCFEARELLKTMLSLHPENAVGQLLLRKAEARSAELEAMLSGSNYLKSWEERERHHQERLTRNRDHRSAPITKLGKLLLDAGYITEEQLDTAVNLQTMLSRFDNHQPLGKVLLDYGYISQFQLDEILRLQEMEYQSQLY